MKQIVIVGGGFAGALTALQLLRQATQPISVTLIESTGRFGRGVAYATQRDEHLLNVLASRMGAFPEAPEGFYQWLVAEGHAYEADDFVPRRLYGDYIASLLAAAPALQLVQDHAISAQWDAQNRRFHLALHSGKSLAADAVVLACGNAEGGLFPSALQAWRWFAGDYPAAITEELLAAPEIHIAGSGLTMVDACVSLARLGYKGRIIATSRHGWLPAAHQAHATLSAPEWARNSVQHPRTALSLLQHIRHSIRQQSDWRAVIDALRPHTPSLWRALPPAEQRRVFHHLFTLWNIHRHRMAPQVAQEIDALQRSGQLILRCGRLRVDALPSPLMDCTGPSYDIRRSQQPLLRDLLAQGVICPAGNGLGLATHASLGVIGPLETRLFALGALTVGEWLECTAVPELRVQAAHVARQLLMQLDHSL